MTRKQLKKLAIEIAKCEIAVQTGSEEEVRKAKDKIVKLTEQADLTLDDIVACDEMVAKILEDKETAIKEMSNAEVAKECIAKCIKAYDEKFGNN